MQSADELQRLWQGESPPSHLRKLMDRVRWHRYWWLAKRIVEAAFTVFVVVHYATYEGHAVGHWLFVPIVIVFFPSLWLLVWRNAHVARECSALGAQSYMHARIEQLQAAIREVKFALAGIAILILYSLCAWWVLHAANAAAEWRDASVQLIWDSLAVSAIVALLAVWQRRRRGRELKACMQALRQMSE